MSKRQGFYQESCLFFFIINIIMIYIAKNAKYVYLQGHRSEIPS